MIPKRINPKEKVGKRKWQKRYYCLKTVGVYSIYFDEQENSLLFCRLLTVIMDVSHLETLDLELHSGHKPTVRLTTQQWSDPIIRKNYRDRGYNVKVVDAAGKVRMSTSL